MDARGDVGLDRQQRLLHARGLLPIKPFKSALVRNLGEQVLRRGAADAEAFGDAAVAAAGEVAKLGQHPAAKPGEQRPHLRIKRLCRSGIGGDRGLHPGPVADCGMDVAKRRLQCFEQLAALTAVNARGFDIDQRFAPHIFIGARFPDANDVAPGIALHKDHRVEQQVDAHAQRGDRGCD